MKTLGNLVKSGMLVALFTGTALMANAEDKWQGTVNFDAANINVDGGTPSFSIGLGAYQKIHPNAMLGFGAQLSKMWNFKGNTLIPVYVGLHAEKFEESLSPMFDFTTGYKFSTGGFDQGSYYLNPLIGVRIGRYGLGVGYLGEKASYEGAKWQSSINIRLAYYFGYHGTKLSRALKHNTSFGMELTADIPLNDGKEVRNTFGEGLNFYLLYSVSDNFKVGPMVGAHNLAAEIKSTWGGDEEWEGDHGSAWFPIALRGKYNARQIAVGGKFYPWARLDLGGYAVAGDELKSGFYWSPAVGLSLDVRGGRSSIDLGISYTSIPTYETTSYHDDNSKTFSTQVLSVVLGYRF